MKRRKVYNVAVVYIVVGFAVAQGAEYFFQLLEFPLAAAQFVAILIAIGFPIALVLAWAYEVRPEEPTEGPVAISPALDTESPAAELRKSILVLPFDNMSPDPGDAYFADGLTEEITTNLSHIHSLRVISRSSAMVLKGTRKDVRTIGRELEVQFVLEGSVRKAADDLRITAQLIDAKTDEHLWAERYDGHLGDVFGMQEDVARSIVDSLQLRLEPKEARRLAEHPIQDLRAYEYFLKATQETWKFTADAMDRAASYLERALEIAGENAVLFAGLAYVHFQNANIGKDLEASYQRAEEFANKALRLNPECAQAHLVLGCLRLINRSTRQGIFHLEKSLESNPQDSTILLWLASAYPNVGRYEDFRSVVEVAVRAEPLTPLYQSLPGWQAIMEGRFAEAVKYYEELHRVDPDNPIAIQQWALALAWGQKLDEAHALLEKKVPEESTNSFSRFSFLLKVAIENDTERMDEIIQGDFEKTLRNDTQFTFFTASLFALAGSDDRALDWVQYAIDDGFSNYPWLAEIDPFLARLRGNTRFEELLRKAKAEWEGWNS
jgi:TolB-like protein/Tfp pilus assembly protein PilF